MKAFFDARIVLVSALLFSLPAGAQPSPAASLKEAAQAAVLKSPEVQARWHASARRLKDQISFIGTQVSLVEKARAAYRDQFNIGQRTLLDLLNTQNEYFDARRSQVNADAELSIAYLRSYAGMGRLLETLDLKRIDADNSPDESELTPIDLAQPCPPATPLDTTLDREALKRKVKEMLDDQSSGVMGKRPQPGEKM